MKFKLTYFIVFLCVILWANFTEAGTIRYCIPKRMTNNANGLNDACVKLSKNQHEIQCVIATDRITCFDFLLTGKADFMVAEPEDLRMVHAYNHSNIVVTHELKKFAESSPQRDVEMLVVVKREPDGSPPTKGKNLCYLGLEISKMSRFDYYYTTYFESWLFSKNCDPKKTVLENRIASLAEHFNSACIAGPWSFDRTVDSALKSKYKSLCELCSNPIACSEQDLHYGMSGALMCLRQGLGEVAWLSRSEVSKYFPQLASSGYSLLCPDGTYKSFAGGNNTCTWIVDPRPVIVANKNVAQIVMDTVKDKGEVRPIFYSVIHASYVFSYLKKLDKAETVEDYLKKFPGYFLSSIKSQSSCSSIVPIRWCISSISESRKCKSIQRAMDALQLSPRFSCVKMQSRNECLEAVNSGKCDVFVARVEEVARTEKQGLKSIIEIMGNKRDDSNSIAAIVKKKSKFKKLADLKGAKACFTGHRSAGWNAFFWQLKNKNHDWDCTDTKAISTYFEESCVLGIDAEATKLPKNLHSLCRKEESNLGPDEKAFKCLVDGADVAFVNVTAAKQYASRDSVFNVNYRLLCPTVNASNSCILAKVSLGSVLVSKNISKVKEDDIYLMFLALDRYFGRTFDRETPMFEMYERFEEEPNVIFPDATMKFEKTIPGLHYGGNTEDFGVSEKSPCNALKSGVEEQRITNVILVLSVFNVLCLQYLYNIFF